MCSTWSASDIALTGRILDWHKTKEGRTEGVPPEEDEGVVAVKKMYDYYKVRCACTLCCVQCYGRANTSRPE